MLRGRLDGAGSFRPGSGRAGRKLALLAGVRQYKTPALRTLNYPDRDVEELAKVLLEAGFSGDDIRVLTQERAARELRSMPSSDNIRTELARMLKLVELRDNPADAVLVALAGHGIMDPKSEASYFCPADTGAKDRAPDDPALIDLGQLYDQLRRSKAGFKLLLVDACPNDPLNPRRAVRPVVDLVSVTRPLKKRPPGGVAALFSCSEGQVSYEDDDLKHGVFFHFVIEGLRGKADADGDGKVLLGELANYTSIEVFRFVDRTRNDEQLPEYLFKANSVPLVERKTPAPEFLTTRIGTIKLMRIPAGEFLMGSPEGDKDADDDERPQHRVRITRPFYLGMTEVTVGQLRRIVESTGYRTEAERDGRGGWGWNEAKGLFEQDPKYNWRSPGFAQTDEYPVVNVSWNDAITFCIKLSELEGLKPFYRSEADAQSGGDGYRLPTESEWEYACRAGTATRYSFGDDPAQLPSFAWIADNSGYRMWDSSRFWKDSGQDLLRYLLEVGRRGCRLHPVGQKRPNAFGLYDMHGNVWEWCWDGYVSRYPSQSPVDDPVGPPQAPVRVFRGGGWSDFPHRVRSASRLRFAPDDRGSLLGFRVARDQFSH